MFQFVYISQGAAPIHPPASSAATHHSCDNAEVRIFREYFHFSYFLLFKKTNLCNAELLGLPPGFQGIPKFQNYLKLPLKNTEFHSNTNKYWYPCSFGKYWCKNTLSKFLTIQIKINEFKANWFTSLVHFCKMLLQNRGFPTFWAKTLYTGGSPGFWQFEEWPPLINNWDCNLK